MAILASQRQAFCTLGSLNLIVLADICTSTMMSLSYHLLFLFFLVLSIKAADKVDPTLKDQSLLHTYIEISNGKLLFNEDATRNVYDEGFVGVLKLAQEAHEKYKFRDGVVYVNTGDGMRHNDSLIEKRIYYTAYDVHKSHLYRNQTGPDFTAMAWGSAQLPSFENEIVKIENASLQKPGSLKVGWIGNTLMNPIRVHLVEMGQKHPDMFDFRHLSANELNSGSGGYTSIPKLVSEHAYLIDAPGSGYSGRLKYLLHSNRPLFYVERNLVEFFNEDLIPNFHYIPIKMDLSNLISQYEWALKNPVEAQEIAHNALLFAQANLTHNSIVDKVASIFKHLLEPERKVENIVRLMKLG